MLRLNYMGYDKLMGLVGSLFFPSLKVGARLGRRWTTSGLGGASKFEMKATHTCRAGANDTRCKGYFRALAEARSNNDNDMSLDLDLGGWQVDGGGVSYAKHKEAAQYDTTQQTNIIYHMKITITSKTS